MQFLCSNNSVYLAWIKICSNFVIIRLRLFYHKLYCLSKYWKIRRVVSLKMYEIFNYVKNTPFNCVFLFLNCILFRIKITESFLTEFLDLIITKLDNPRQNLWPGCYVFTVRIPVLTFFILLKLNILRSILILFFKKHVLFALQRQVFFLIYTTDITLIFICIVNHFHGWQIRLVLPMVYDYSQF